MKILYVEDEQDIAIPVQVVLKRKGLQVDYTPDGREAIKLLRQNSYDCLLLDLNLPGVDGIEVAKAVKQERLGTPILMLTARGSLEEKLSGFEVGTDDYLVKPFEMLEVVARVEALIRRNSANKQLQVQIGELLFYPGRNLLLDSDNKKEVQLSNKESALLEYLVRNENKAVSAEELLEHVWDSNVNSFSDTVKTHIKTLRKKLGRQANLIKTLKGKGYLYQHEA
jgi:DNA-binding response OmpR family regulator